LQHLGRPNGFARSGVAGWRSGLGHSRGVVSRGALSLVKSKIRDVFEALQENRVNWKRSR